MKVVGCLLSITAVVNAVATNTHSAVQHMVKQATRQLT